VQEAHPNPPVAECPLIRFHVHGGSCDQVTW
jgi:hypothetical protein